MKNKENSEWKNSLSSMCFDIALLHIFILAPVLFIQIENINLLFLSIEGVIRFGIIYFVVLSIFLLIVFQRKKSGIYNKKK